MAWEDVRFDAYAYDRVEDRFPASYRSVYVDYLYVNNVADPTKDSERHIEYRDGKIYIEIRRTGQPTDYYPL